jgi:hypothetical protein
MRDESMRNDFLALSIKRQKCSCEGNENYAKVEMPP